MREVKTPFIIRLILSIGIASLLFIFGLFILVLIPGLGWIVGGFLILMAIFGILTPFTTTGSMLYGRCPRCNTTIKVSADKKACNCPVCKKRLLVTKKGYELA